MEYCQPVLNDDEKAQEKTTKFISLDKCLPGKAFLSIAFVEPPPDTDPSVLENPTLQYDPEWLAVLRKTHTMMEPNRRQQTIPRDPVHVTTKDIEWVMQHMESLDIPDNFVATLPPIPPPLPAAAAGVREPQNYDRLPPPLPQMGNPQTDELLQKLELEHIITIPYDPNCLNDYYQRQQQHLVPIPLPVSNQDENEIDIDDDIVVDEMVDDANAITLKIFVEKQGVATAAAPPTVVVVAAAAAAAPAAAPAAAAKIDDSNEIHLDEELEDDIPDSFKEPNSDAKKPRIS